MTDQPKRIGKLICFNGRRVFDICPRPDDAAATGAALVNQAQALVRAQASIEQLEAEVQALKLRPAAPQASQLGRL